MEKRALIAGAGPAGLTAALELIRRSDIKPILFETLDDVGGISRTINYLGNRMDIGGHRFFSKSDWVMNWWREMMPVAPEKTEDGFSIVPEKDGHMLIRPRLSRIYFLRRFFDYPVSLSATTMSNLGAWRLIKIGASYLWVCIFQRKPEHNLEDFFTNRFGGELYRTFFKDYTEKVWGVPCNEISPDWGAQRVKGLSVIGTLLHAVKKFFSSSSSSDVSQKNTNTSLIERFLYPKLGPGQMWQIVAKEVLARGGEIHHGHRVAGVNMAEGKVTSVDTIDRTGNRHNWQGDWLISTMAVRDLFTAMQPPPPEEAKRVANGLCYRDFMTMGLLLRKLKPTKDGKGPQNLVPDTWIYIQEPDVKIGRLQIFNNWSPALVRDKDTVWIGLEYFCQEGDELWSKPDEEFSRFAIDELEKIDLIDSADVLDWHVERIPKAYPAYFGTYNEFENIREFTDTIPNLFLVGRNGMHRYNNQDHSMLTANLAVEAILSGSSNKDPIWTINVDDEYHEEKKA
jgi:protoporphyrinogen oxidase